MRLFTLFVKYGSGSDPYCGVYTSIEFLHGVIKEVIEDTKIPKYEVPSVEHIEKCLEELPCHMIHIFSDSTWLYIQEVEPGLITHVRNAAAKDIKEGLLKSVTAEPEFPGEVSEDEWKDIKEMVEKGNRETMAEIFRDIVRATKKDIADRITKSNI